mmetsp:Transcript_48087/g.35288  ORF Transcript_48087/g.35288 Transcript_48087/m.35288 type:complete len:153 (-) Transcript_48087:11-469(-)|eukprot:CAMPEP_0202964024 /NCGR_PEP_ID=MMETSP1396-20130829/8090_1 /ASSEMBLY_ACC=CAM_ASM_000872 /TAXON_ID= /ORGANISM="Pseudokeronopsis sp., Strain Brazil" /LENGTH=152 /DNA_ID=CAMNT_0049685777 /DNA_START=875 /DNA_END=1333 /DNA_ORIENTATION=-
MEGVVAERYIERGEDPRVVLAGDAAHAFPPSGGFGMNTGIGDAFNLAHKFSYLFHVGGGGEVMKAYDEERRYVGEATCNCALINYEKGVKLAQMLNLDHNNARLLTKLVKLAPFGQKEIFKGMFDSVLAVVQQTNKFMNKEVEVRRFLREKE